MRPSPTAIQRGTTSGRDPGEIHRALTAELGESVERRVEAPATPAQKRRLAKLAARDVSQTQPAGERIEAISTARPAMTLPSAGSR